MTTFVKFTGKLVEENGVSVDSYSTDTQIIRADAVDFVTNTPDGYRVIAGGKVFAINTGKRADLEAALAQAGILVG